MKPVWIIDDDRSIRWVFEKALKRENLPYRIFETAEEALDALETESAGAILSDIRMPGMDGLEFMSRLKARLPKVPVIIMTAYSDLDSAVSAFQGGAFEYLPKPFDINHALALIHRALEEGGSGEENLDGQQAAASQGMLGQAPAMQDVFRAIGRLSQSHTTVLITGETGTGKELVAHALHRHSPRKEKPFIALNTAAIPKDLLESELFGHERGAFTGATASRRGRFEQADGEFYRVGGISPVRVNVRVIAATHQNLEDRVRQGQFREDLFHRLNVIRIKLPPLRERREDIPLLVRHFLQKSARELGVEAKLVSDEANRALAALPYPGNVRQLENLCHWLTVMAPGQVIEAKDMPPDALHEPSVAALDWTEALARIAQGRLAKGESGILDDLTAEFERTLIRVALDHTGGRRIEAANLLGWGRNTLTRKIQELMPEENGE